MRFINHYHDHPKYIKALAHSIRDHWAHNDRADRLLFSFHGIPQRYFDAGDPYFCHCQKTARLVAEKLQLNEFGWQVVFQSRFGKEPWIQPYTDETLEQLAKTKNKSVEVICPGFAADCVETLKEIAVENGDIFKEAGGRNFAAIPCLNDTDGGIRVLVNIIKRELMGWI